MVTKKTKSNAKLTVKSIRSINMESRDYMLLHKRMFVLFDGIHCKLYLDSKKNIFVPISLESANDFLNYEMSFIVMVDFYATLIGISAINDNYSFVLPF